jgi:hypothetical protein
MAPRSRGTTPLPSNWFLRFSYSLNSQQAPTCFRTPFFRAHHLIRVPCFCFFTSGLSAPPSTAPREPPPKPRRRGPPGALRPKRRFPSKADLPPGHGGTAFGTLLLIARTAQLMRNPFTAAGADTGTAGTGGKPSAPAAAAAPLTSSHAPACPGAFSSRTGSVSSRHYPSPPSCFSPPILHVIKMHAAPTAFPFRHRGLGGVISWLTLM